MAENKKIRNARQVVYAGIKFKSELEALVYRTFEDAGYTIAYEPSSHVLWEGFRPTVPYYKVYGKGVNKKWRLDMKKIVDIRYTPDFKVTTQSGVEVFIEAKGIPNDVFYIKEKLFRAYLEKLNSEGRTVCFFQVRNKTQILKAIEIIKVIEKSKSKQNGEETK